MSAVVTSGSLDGFELVQLMTQRAGHQAVIVYQLAGGLLRHPEGHRDDEIRLAMTHEMCEMPLTGTIGQRYFQ